MLLIRSLNRGGHKPHSATLAMATSLFLALVGIGMAVYLISIRYSENPGSGNTEVIDMAPTANYAILRKRWGEVLVEEQLH